MLRVKDKGMLHVTLIAIGLDTYFIELVCGSKFFTIHFSLFTFMRLSAFTLLLHHADTAMKDIVACSVVPAVLQIPLAYISLVKKAVTIHIVVSVVILIV